MRRKPVASFARATSDKANGRARAVLALSSRSAIRDVCEHAPCPAPAWCSAAADSAASCTGARPRSSNRGNRRRRARSRRRRRGSRPSRHKAVVAILPHDSGHVAKVLRLPAPRPKGIFARRPRSCSTRWLLMLARLPLKRRPDLPACSCSGRMVPPTTRSVSRARILPKRISPRIAATSSRAIE